MRIAIEGAGGHAGGVLMPDRRDALCAAAELILAIELAARSSGAVDTVATVGICEVFPARSTAFPAGFASPLTSATPILTRRDRVIKAMEDACNTIAAKRRWQFTPNAECRCTAECAPTSWMRFQTPAGNINRISSDGQPGLS